MKIKLALPPPLLKKPRTPPQKEEFMGMGVFQQKVPKLCQAPIKLAQPFPAPRITGGNFMDTRIFLTKEYLNRARRP